MRHFVFLLAIVSCLGQMALAAPAEQTAPPQVPWGILSLKSLDRTQELLSRIVEFFPGSIFRDSLSRIEKVRGLAGVDATAPVVVLVSSQSGDLKHPRILVVLPISDAPAFIDACRRLPRVALTEEEPGRWTFVSGERSLYCATVGSGFVLSNDATFRGQAAQAIVGLEQLRTELDVAFRFRPEGLPPDLMARWEDWMDSEMGKLQAQIRLSEKAEVPLLLASLQFFREWTRRCVHETEFVEVGASLQPALHLEACWTAKTNSALAESLTRLAVKVGKFDGISLDEPALECNCAINIPVAVRALLALAFVQVRQTVSDEIGPRLKPQDRKPAEGALWAIAETVNAGRLESSLVFRAGENAKMSLYTTVRTQGTDRIRESLQTVLPYAALSRDVQDVTMNVLEEEQLLLHRVVPEKLKGAERLVYGEDASFLIGTTSHAFVLAVGQIQLASELSGIRTEAVQSPELLSLRCHLRPWVLLLQKNDPDSPTFNHLLDSLPVQNPDDQIRAGVRVEGRQLQLACDFAPGCLKFFVRMAGGDPAENSPITN